MKTKKGWLASVIKGIKLDSTVAHKLNQGCAGGPDESG